MKNLIIIYLAAVLLQSCTGENKNTLPILGNRQVVEKEVNGKMVVDTVYQTIPPFSLTNQDSVVVTEKAFDGKIYVADFFFTSCNSICPIMHRNMLKIYTKYLNNKEVKFISHSIDTKYDTPSRLKRYADKLGVKGNQWEFVHGSYDAIFNQAAKNYLVTAFQDKTEPQGLVHDGWFLLVDKQKHMRGAYDGTKDDQVEKLMKDMDILLQEK
ncbi:MAG: electron transport protein SCO1/SenC [Sphingobacteriales bacterium]|nr:electron transport protein SCO1/SenC [Sphingobacteriales bacterium]